MTDNVTEIDKKINELLSKVNILDVIKKRAQIEKKADYILTNCPMCGNDHGFSINLTKQCFYCFSCYASGNASDFIRQFENCAHIDVIKSLEADIPNIGEQEVNYETRI